MKNREIYCLNNISRVGTGRFRKGYTLVDEIDHAAGVLVRSADMKAMDFPPTLRAIGRAGAGVNNIPLDRCAEQGIVVFNTPGANANAVKELIICSMLLGSRGIIAGNQQQYAMQDRLKGFMDAVQAKGPEIVWTVEESRFLEQELQRSMERVTPAVIIGLDNTSLEAAVDYVAASGTDRLSLYGAGCSEKLAYYIDNGTIASMILPNEFSMGYQSLTDLSAKLRNRMLVLEDREQGFNVVHQDNLFRDENQRILFPIVQ